MIRRNAAAGDLFPEPAHADRQCIGVGGDGIQLMSRQRSPRVVTGLWSLTNHVCRHCMGGRVLKRLNPDGTVTVMCSICETSGDDSPVSICACGMRFNDITSGPGKRKGKNMGIRCIPNPSRGPASPAVFVAAEV